MKQRKLSEKFMNQWKEGELYPLLEAIHEDDTICMELRGKEAHLYYRGGRLFRIQENTDGYVLIFNTTYCDERSKDLPAHPTLKEAIELLPRYKQAMDWRFHHHPKYEREFQQLIERENNALIGEISKSTDYYIVDMEYAENKALSQFDMVAFKWLSEKAERKNPQKPTLALIEVKYGDKAIDGDAGIQKHVADLNEFLANKTQLADFCEDMSQVFRQKCELGLVKGLLEKQYPVSISPENVEVILIFANHDPDKSAFGKELAAVKEQNYPFPIKIARASMMGYGLYANRLRDITDF